MSKRGGRGEAAAQQCNAQADSAWASPTLLAMLKRGDADAELDFGGRRLPVHSAMLALSSEPLAGMLEAAGAASKRPKVLKVEGDPLGGWFHALAHMYPLTSATPALDWGNVAAMLPVIHKYDCSHLLDVCRAWLEEDKQQFSAVSGSDANVCSWLELGDRLQLDYIKTKALAFIKSEFVAGRMHLLKETASLSKVTVGTLAEVVALVADAPPANSLGPTFQCSGCRSQFVVKPAPGRVRSLCPVCGYAPPYHVIVP